MSAFIQIIDDDPSIRILLATILENAGYRTREAADGPSGLAALEQALPDLVVLDFMMPGMSGAEVCQQIRARWGLQLPVVCVSALEDRAARLAAMEAGCDEFLTKPIDRVELLLRVRNLLRLKAELDQREERRRRLEQDLLRMEETLQRAERLASLGSMAGNVGHELKNLGMILYGVLDVVKEAHDEDRSPTTEDISALDRVSQHLVAHARQLESLSKPRPDLVEEVDLREMVQPCIEGLKRLGRIKHCKIELELPREPLLARVSRVRFEQVLQNLVVNGADAVKQARRKQGSVRVRLRRHGDRALVAVEDNGCGIPAEARERIFDPYYTTKSADTGTGLGLTIVRSLVVGFGGTLKVESTPDEGSRFFFEVPVA